MRHDQIWKEILWNFFAEFMELFFPEVAKRLDFSRIRLLDVSLFTDLPEGARREPDLLVEAHTRDGEVEIILVHIEIQVKHDRKVPYRMWEYYNLLRLRRKHRVFPLVVYLEASVGGLAEERYVESLLGRSILSFSYAVVALPDLSADEYMERENVLAPALSALMQGEQTGRVLRKLRAYQRMARSHLDEAKRSLLMYVIDRYAKLNRDEEAEMNRLMEGSEMQEVKEIITSYEERGVKKGIKQGIEQGIEQGIVRGIVRGKREALLIQMRYRFGELPESVIARIERIKSSKELDELVHKVLDARSLEEMGLLKE